LDSALEQTWPNTEIILSDDGKTDEVRRICADYEPRVQYVRNPNPEISGYNNARHLCHLARGKYLKFQLDDDLLHPECIRLMVAAMERTGAHLAFPPRRLIDEYGNPLPPPAPFEAAPLFPFAKSLLNAD
jgi:glycosyltransferase involved in cell wall biosynthesis